MNIRTIIVWGGILVLLLQSACQSPTEPEDQNVPKTTYIRGYVLRSDNLQRVPNAIVADVRGTPTDTSKSDGSFSLKYDLTTQYQATVIGKKDGFTADTISLVLQRGVDTTGVSLVLKADSASPPPGASSGKAANIILIGSTGENISIRGTGPNETATLTFEVRDSLGIPVSGVNKIKVNFSILGGPAGGEYVFPVSGETDPVTGRVTTRVTSGIKAGVLQVFASVTVNGVQIKSSPVRITISGGLPVAERFSLSRQLANIAGGVFDNLRAKINVVVGDKYGNPVQVGTAVYFTTTGGIIQPSALTDKDGIASVDLISGNPRPANSTAVITAKTIGDSGVTISKQISVIFSGRTTIVGPTATLVIPDSGLNEFVYRVEDPNGYPLVGGTRITVSVEGPGATDLELFGDKERTLPDTEDPSFTSFKVSVRDKKLGGGGGVTFKIAVTSQNGDLTYTFPGFVSQDTSQVPPSLPPSSRSGYASSLSLLSVSSTEVSVRGTGDEETARLVFVARDSLGNTIDITKRAYVTFQISPAGGVGGGEFLSPTADSTNASGQVTTTFNAGTRAGVIQVIARTTVLGRTITSSPVRLAIAGGLPVEERFSISREKKNIAGGVFDGLRARFSVILGDKDGNPVRPTAVYFTTTGGIIQPSAITDKDGSASVQLISAEPRPLGGIATVTARTISESGTTISKSARIVFSGLTRIIAPTTAFEVPDSGSFSFAYKVQDVNGNPLTQGTSINVAVSGPGATDLEVTGDKTVQLPDTDDPSFTSFFVTIRDTKTRGASGPVTVTITVTSENGKGEHKFSGTVKPGADVINVPPSAREPAKVAIIGNPTASDIFVSGVGAIENSVITYEVQDSLGTPIDTSRRVTATFSVDFKPNTIVQGGTAPTVIPTSAVTDAAGRFTASVQSGTQAGTIQLVARISLPGGKIIESRPVKITVHGGFPDQAHFTLLPSFYSFAGLGYANVIRFQVFVGDTFSNPVQSGTAIYFNSQAGIMQTGNDQFNASYTNSSGIAFASLYTVNPKPNALPFYDPTYGPGYHWVYAHTQGRGGTRVIDSVLVLQSMGPITISGLPASITIPQRGTSAPISFTVKDGNNNPLPAGTTITATVAFDNSVTGLKFVVGGDFSETAPTYTIPNAGFARFTGSGVTDYVLRVQDASSNGAQIGTSCTITVSVNAPNIGIRSVSFPGTVQ